MTSQPEIRVSRFRSDEAGRVTADAMKAWHREGLLVIEDFASLDQCRQLISAADALVEDFDEEEVVSSKKKEGMFFSVGYMSHFTVNMASLSFKISSASSGNLPGGINKKEAGLAISRLILP